MSVPNQIPYNIYTANGQTTVFTYEFYIISASDLEVSINGSAVTSGYTVSGVGNKDGGDITFLTPPANGAVVMLERVVPTYRLTDYQDNGDLLADTVNKDFDRIWMAIQRAFIDLGFALTRPFLGGPFNAKGYRIENLSDPVNDQDAATKKYVSETGKLNLARTLRVPESSISMLPSINGRKNKILAFNDMGNPIGVLPESGSAADVMIELASSDGFKLIGQVTSYANLQSIIPEYAGQRILLQSYLPGWAATLRGPEGGGEFVSLPGSVVDDGGYLCQPAGTTLFHWRRVVNSMTLTPEMFGAICDSQRQLPGTDSTVAINKMFSSAIRRNNAVEFVSMAAGSNAAEFGYYVTSAILATGIHVIKGDPVFHYASATFDKSNGAYCLCLGDPFTDRTTIQNGLTFGTITTRDLSLRATVMGVFI